MTRAAKNKILGQGLVEVMVGIGLIGFLALAGTQISGIIGKENEKMVMEAQAVTLESWILQALSSSDGFNPAGLTAMKNGVPTLPTLALVNSDYPTGLGLVGNGSANAAYFDRWAKRCTASGSNPRCPGQPLCASAGSCPDIKAEIYVAQRASNGYGAAYRIRALQGAPFPPLGYQDASQPIESAPMSRSIPASIYTVSAVKHCPDTTVGMWGYDNANGAYCLEKPSVPCPAGSMAKGFVVDTGSTVGTHKLEFRCVKLKKLVCTDPNFMLQKIPLQCLDPAANATTAPNCAGQLSQACVFKYVPTLTVPSTTPATPCPSVMINGVATAIYDPSGTQCTLKAAYAPQAAVVK